MKTLRASWRSIELREEGEWARLILRRPPLNVVDAPMAEEIAAALAACRGAARVVQVEAAPDCRAFSAGVEVADHLPERAPAMLARFDAIFREMAAADFMTLAVVRGAALGGGAELAIACDAVVAGEAAVFGFPEIKVGCFPPLAMALLPRLVGLRRAEDWILSGRNVSAAEAAAAGLARLAPEGDLEEAAARVRQDWLRLSSAVLRVTRRALRRDWMADLEAAEALYRSEILPLADAREGVAAFLEKRAPAWKHA
ncbi:MAG TPA: enoyl-CoA hydratase-related protein [Terriglobales bacterium]|nr:enoyl-CoA hydratase-related protein [Terriglobales bacterium]